VGVTHDAALAFYLVVLWGALLGIVAPANHRSEVCVRSKQLAAVTFVCLLFEAWRY
jgi:hypothetical protein